MSYETFIGILGILLSTITNVTSLNLGTLNHSLQYQTNRPVVRHLFTAWALSVVVSVVLPQSDVLLTEELVALVALDGLVNQPETNVALEILGDLSVFVHAVVHAISDMHMICFFRLLQ